MKQATKAIMNALKDYANPDAHFTLLVSDLTTLDNLNLDEYKDDEK